MIFLRKLLSVGFIPLFFVCGVFLQTAFGQEAQQPQPQQQQQSQDPAKSNDPPPQPGTIAPQNPPPIDKRIFGVLPNYRTAQLSGEYHPITAKQKLTIALKDSFDYPLYFVGAAYAGLYQLDDSHPQFGQGVKGYAKRFGTSYCDQVTGNMLTEGFMPILFKEDPRYFRIGSGGGTKWHRTGYALTRIFVTRTDAGGKSFNFAEIIGNGMAAGIGLAYYSDDRDFPDYLQNWGTELATDAISQVLKEFWPDIKKKLFKRHATAPTD
jgi:hypothetical protein